MSLEAELIEEPSPSSGAVGRTNTSIISGIRPPRRKQSARLPLPGPTGSFWAPCAAVAWLLALTPAAVDAVRASFDVAVFIALLQAALIVVGLMQFAWRRRIHALVIGVGALFGALFVAMISFDRSEYRPDVERFETTLRAPAGPSTD